MQVVVFGGDGVWRWWCVVVVEVCDGVGCGGMW